MKNAIATIMTAAILATAVAFDCASAEDEDTAASAYLVFDAETGEFITVDDPNRTQMHVAEQDAIESGSADAAVTAEAGSEMNSGPVIFVVGAVAVALVLGAVLWLRSHGRRGQTPE